MRKGGAQKMLNQPRPQGPFCHALEIGTPGQVQRHSDFEWLCKHNSPLWKRVIAWERSHAASGYGIIWGDADRNEQEEFFFF